MEHSRKQKALGETRGRRRRPQRQFMPTSTSTSASSSTSTSTYTYTSAYTSPSTVAWEVPEERAMCIKGILQSFEIGKEAMELRQEQLVEDWALYQAIFTNLKFARAGELREEEEKKTTHTLPLLLLLLLILLLCFLEVKQGFDLT
jgi:hypothetical protein